VAGLQSHTPVEIRGRVMSIYTIISQVVSAMAGVLSGWLAQEDGASMSLFVIGVLFIAFTSILMLKGVHLKRLVKL
jgi:MFS family permease